MKLFLAILVIFAFATMITTVKARGTGDIYSGDQSIYLQADDEFKFDICDNCGELYLSITPTFNNLTISPAISVSCYSDGNILDLQVDGESSLWEITYRQEVICTKECEISYKTCGSEHPDYCIVSTNNNVLVAYDFKAYTTCPFENFLIWSLIILGLLVMTGLYCIFPAFLVYLCCKKSTKVEGTNEGYKTIV